MFARDCGSVQQVFTWDGNTAIAAIFPSNRRGRRSIAYFDTRYQLRCGCCCVGSRPWALELERTTCYQESSRVRFHRNSNIRSRIGVGNPGKWRLLSQGLHGTKCARNTARRRFYGVVTDSSARTTYCPRGTHSHGRLQHTRYGAPECRDRTFPIAPRSCILSDHTCSSVGARHSPRHIQPLRGR